MADISPTVANVLAATGASLGTGTAGVNITQGELLYSDGTDGGKLKLADDLDAATSAVVGISLNAALTNQPVDFIKSGTLTFGTVVVGDIYALSTTAGVMMDTQPATGNFASSIAIGLTTATLKVLINNSGVAAS